MPAVPRRPVRVVGRVHASGVRCPVSAVTVQCPRTRCPRVRCPMSECGRPASRVGVRAFRVRCVCAGDLRTASSAAGNRTARRARPGRPAVSRERLDHLPEPQWPSSPACLATRSSGWKRRLPSVVIMGGPGPSRLVAESLPGWTGTCARGRSAAATCSERRRLDAGDALTCCYGGGGEGI
jgi:hypothetical protein